MKKWQMVWVFSLCSLWLKAQLPALEDLKKVQNAEIARLTGVFEAQMGQAGASIDILAHRFEFDVQPERRYLRGVVVTRFRTETAIDSLVFDLDNNLLVDSVLFQNRRVDFGQWPDKTLSIRLPLSIAAHRTDSVAIFYQGQPQETGFGGFVQRFRSLPNRDSVGEVWTLSQPYGSRQWFPGKMDLRDKVDTLDILLTVPWRYKGVANGLLHRVDTPETGQHRFHWQHKYPIANYLIAFAVTNFDTFFRYIPQATGDSLLFQNWVYPEQKSDMLLQSQRFEPMFALFERLFGPYPFKKEAYGHAQCGFGGGMEHQTLSFMANLNSPLMAHELAHQWFGDKITCGSWQDIWLNEGFASYLTGLHYQYVDTLYWGAWRLQVSNDALRAATGSVFVTDTTLVSRIFNGDLSYHKGAYLLHMLRWRLGDAVFFEGMRQYAAAPQWAYGFARATDFKQHMERVSGEDLTEFFNDWFYGQGYPSYTLRFCRNYGPLYIEQTTSHPSVRFFEMPLQLTLRASRIGWDTTIVVSNTMPIQAYNIDIPSQKRWEIDTIIVDPNIWLLSKNNKVYVSVCTATQEVSPTIFRVVPTAVDHTLYIQHTAAAPVVGHWRITDVAGRQWARGQTEIYDHFTTDVGALPAGLYFWQIQTSKGWETLKFIKI